MHSTKPLNLIVPLDGSELAERALPAALALAGSDGRISLVRVVVPLNPVYDDVLRRYLPMTEQDRERQEREARRSLHDAASKYDAAPGRISPHITVGDPAEGILAAAEESGADMIVMTSHGRGAIDRWRFGSVADRIARAATIPVMVLRADTSPSSDPPRLTRLVLAYDGSDLAARAIPVAAMLSRRLALPIHVIRVLDLARIMARTTYEAPIPGNVVQGIEDAVRADANESVRDVSLRLRSEGIDAQGAVLIGPVAPTLLSVSQPGDLLMLTSHGRGGVRRWLLGSIAEKLVRLAEAPVVLVPADREAAKT